MKVQDAAGLALTFCSRRTLTEQAKGRFDGALQSVMRVKKRERAVTMPGTRADNRGPSSVT